jgi:hypothetical protein
VTAGFPLPKERRAGPIAWVLIVSIMLKQCKEKAMHRSAWKGNSAKFVFCAFSEVQHSPGPMLSGILMYRLGDFVVCT